MNYRTSLAVQWLRPYIPTSGARVPSLVWELRFCMPHSNSQSKQNKTKQKQVKRKKEMNYK